MRTVPFRIASISPVTPAYFIGDSNVLAFRHLSVELPPTFARNSVTNACFVPGLSVATLFERGALHPRVRAYLRNELALDLPIVDAEARRLAGIARRELNARTRGTPEDAWNTRAEPVMVLMVGTIDLATILGTLGPNADFYCDDPAYVDSAFPPSFGTAIPVDVVEDRLEEMFAPLHSGITALRSLGITRLYLHSLHPPTLDDVGYFDIRGIACSAKLRYKVTLAINRIMRRIADVTQCGFLDMWNATTHEGVLDERFSLDGDHLNAHATALTLASLFEAVLIARSQPLRDGEAIDLSDRSLRSTGE